MTAVIMAALEHWQCKQIVFCATIYRQEGLSVIHASMPEPWLSHHQPQTWLSQRQEVYASYTCIFIFTRCRHWFRQMDASLNLSTLINTLLLSVCTEQSEWVLTGNGASSHPGEEPVMSGFSPCLTFTVGRGVQLPFLFSWSVPSELLIIYISPSFPCLFSPPSPSPARSNPHLCVLCLCLLPVALRRALFLMYLRPPQAAVFTRPLQGGNRRRMTWSMFPAEESTAFSLLQLSQPFFIISSLCSSRYR